TQCVLDTTKFPNGTRQLVATVTGTDGSTRSDVISVNVQNAATTVSPTPTTTTTTPTPTTTTTTPTPASGPANLLFWSGFEGGLALSTPNDCYSNGCFQTLNGKDSVSGFSWPITTVANSSNQFQLLVNRPRAGDPSPV